MGHGRSKCILCTLCLTVACQDELVWPSHYLWARPQRIPFPTFSLLSRFGVSLESPSSSIEAFLFLTTGDLSPFADIVLPSITKRYSWKQAVRDWFMCHNSAWLDAFTEFVLIEVCFGGFNDRGLGSEEEGEAKMIITRVYGRLPCWNLLAIKDTTRVGVFTTINYASGISPWMRQQASRVTVLIAFITNNAFLPRTLPIAFFNHLHVAYWVRWILYSLCFARVVGSSQLLDGLIVIKEHSLHIFLALFLRPLYCCWTWRVMMISKLTMLLSCGPHLLYN